MFHEFFYTHLFPGHTYRGEYLLQEGDETSKIIFIESGEYEVTINVEGTDIVIERLSKGSILNLNNIFLDDV